MAVSSMKQTKAGKGYKECQGWDAVLKSIGREASTEKGIFQQRHKGGEGVSHVDFWGKNFPGSILASGSP